jgi:hypothetical protein
MNQQNEEKDKLRLEMLRIKLQKIHSIEDKMRIQHIQQELDKDLYEKTNTKNL